MSLQGQDRRVFVLDRLVVAPGRLADVRAAFAQRYRPMAEKHGLRLEQLMLSPPVELDDGDNEVLLLWSTADVAAYWSAYAKAAVESAEAVAIWTELDAMLVSRTRQCLSTWGDE